MLETAYPEVRVIVERNRTCAQLRMWAREAIEGKWKEITLDEALPNRAPTPRPELQMMMIPLGPVVVFGASNFPLAYSTAGGDVASALAAGCPVIVKAHDSHLGTNALVAEVIMEAARSTGMPDGVFSSINGDGFQTGRQLVTHPLTAAVGFTGSKPEAKLCLISVSNDHIPSRSSRKWAASTQSFCYLRKLRQILQNSLLSWLPR